MFTLRRSSLALEVRKAGTDGECGQTITSYKPPTAAVRYVTQGATALEVTTVCLAMS